MTLPYRKVEFGLAFTKTSPGITALPMPPPSDNLLAPLQLLHVAATLDLLPVRGEGQHDAACLPPQHGLVRVCVQHGQQHPIWLYVVCRVEEWGEAEIPYQGGKLGRARGHLVVERTKLVEARPHGGCHPRR